MFITISRVISTVMVQYIYTRRFNGQVYHNYTCHFNDKLHLQPHVPFQQSNPPHMSFQQSQNIQNTKFYM